MSGDAKHDHERIWLEPRAAEYREEGRLWCQDNVWTDACEEHGECPTEYVRADLFAAALREAEARGMERAIAECERAMLWSNSEDHWAGAKACREMIDSLRRAAQEGTRDE